MARDAIGEADLAVRAGADAQVVAEFPVVQVVAAAMTGPRERRGLVVLVTRLGERLLESDLHVGAGVVLRERRRSAVEGRVRLDRQLVRRDMGHTAGEC